MLATLRYRLLIDRPGGPPRAFAMGVRERDEAVDSPLYVRGELDQPGEVVPRGLVRVLCDESSASIAAGSGRRELADWLASPANPLTARVMVNRVWLHLFGRGLVPTPDNFGAAGQPPSHPELLDTLAVEFMADGWSIKRLIRRIVLSRAYGLDSAHDPQQLRGRPRQRPRLADEQAPARGRGAARRPAVRRRPARDRAAGRVGGGPHRRGPGAVPPRRRPGRLGHASVGLPAGGPGPGARVARPVRLRRPEPRDGRAGHDDRPGPGALLHERPVRDPAGRGPGRAASAPIEGDDARRVDRAYRLALARPPTAEERDRALAFLRDFAARAEGPTRRARPGRRSARPSSPAPSSDTWTDREPLHERGGSIR